MTYWMATSDREKFRAAIGPDTVVTVGRRILHGRRDDGEPDGVPGTRFRYSFYETKPSRNGWTFEETFWGVPHAQFVDEFTIDESGSLYNELLLSGKRMKRVGF